MALATDGSVRRAESSRGGAQAGRSSGAVGTAAGMAVALALAQVGGVSWALAQVGGASWALVARGAAAAKGATSGNRPLLAANGELSVGTGWGSGGLEESGSVGGRSEVIVRLYEVWQSCQVCDTSTQTA